MSVSRTSGTAFAIKAAVDDVDAASFTFEAQKTMYGGKRIADGDTVFVFASENEGGPGLIAKGVVTSAKLLPRRRRIVRQTPRVSISIKRTAVARRPLGRRELKPFANWDDGWPETELNFKFYRQATNKVVGISAEAATFLEGFFVQVKRARSKLLGLFAAAFVPIGMSACSSTLCDLSYHYGLSITVQDSVTSQSLVGDGTTITVRDGSYLDLVQQVGEVYQAAGERPGTYSIEVQRAGYRDWTRANVRLRDEGCHVERVTVTARLQASP